MRRLIYAMPILALLVPWTFVTLVVIAVGMLWNPFSLILLWPLVALFAAAWWVYRQHTKRGQHGFAAFSASLVLASPLFAILVAFCTHGAEVLDRPEYRPMAERALADAPQSKSDCSHEHGDSRAAKIQHVSF